jgi:valyl-tRNA synthetase
LKNREQISISIDSELYTATADFMPKIKKLVWIDKIDQETESSAVNIGLVKNKKIIVHSDKMQDTADVKKKVEDEIQYIKGFIKSIESKLNNQGFVAKAPEKVLEMERKKLADGQEKLSQLEEQLKISNS